MPTDVPPTRYCFRCGRKLADAPRPGCWYCGAPTQRELRRPKKCAFCGEYIAHDAIKCKHCGEFLDGRPAPETAAPPPVQQVVFVVDKDVLRAARDRALPAGQPVPEEIARHLAPETLRAIEANQPAQLQQPGVRALLAGPAAEPPPAGAVIDLPARAAPAAETEALPARAPRGGWRRLLGRAGAAAPPRSAAGAPPDLDARLDETFRICERCGTEILRADNYCFHCGMQYHLTNADVRRMERARSHAPLVTGLLLAAAVLAIVFQGLLPLRGGGGLLLGAVCFLWGTWALVRHPGLSAKLAAFMLVLAGLLVALLFTYAP